MADFNPQQHYTREELDKILFEREEGRIAAVMEANKRKTNTGAPNTLPQTLKNLGVSPKSDQQSNTSKKDKWGPLPPGQSDWTGPDLKRKPISLDQETLRFLNSKEFLDTQKDMPLSQMGLGGLKRGGARVFHKPVKTDQWGGYKLPLRGAYEGDPILSDAELTKLMLGKDVYSEDDDGRPSSGLGEGDETPYRIGKYDRETFEDMGASEGASLRDIISVNDYGRPNNDLNRTQTIHHEFRHRAISILRERGINIEKITGLREEDLLRTMDHIENKEGMWSPENYELNDVKRAKELLKTEGDTITPERRKEIEDGIKEVETEMKNLKSWSKHPRVLAGIVQLQKAAMDAMADFAKKLAASTKLGDEFDAPGEGPGFQGPDLGIGPLLQK